MAEELFLNPGCPETLDGSSAEINVPAIAPKPMPKIKSLAPYTNGETDVCLWGGFAVGRTVGDVTARA